MAGSETFVESSEALLINKETELRQRFLSQATVREPEKRYISAPQVNQLLIPRDIDLAAQLIAEHYRRSGKKFDKVTGIQYSGVPLAYSVARVLDIPYAPSRKQREVPGSWQRPLIIDEEVESFTSGISSAHAFNIHPGDEVLVVDDVIAHGTTAIPILVGMQRGGVKVQLAAFFAKLFEPGVEELRRMDIEPFYAIGIERLYQKNGIWKPQLAPPHFS